jgi:putative ABC transport system substrate-binding protein
MRLGRALRCAFLLILLGIVPISGWADGLRVLVVLSDDAVPYLSFARELKNNLPALMQTTVLEHPGEYSSSTPQADFIISVGMKATELATAQIGTPVLAVMVPKTSYENLLARISPQAPALSISAIYLDQPWGRQLDFVRAVLPERRKIGLLYSNDTRIDVAQLHHDIAHRGGSLIARPVRFAENLYSNLESVLNDSDVLLAIPDSAIYSSNNIRNILLTSYRYHIPLIGLSQSYVNAGALCAIFSTPEQLAEQASLAAILFARTGQLPDSQYPAAFTIAVNQQVARSLGIELPPPEAIRNQMDKTKLKEQGR